MAAPSNVETTTRLSEKTLRLSGSAWLVLIINLSSFVAPHSTDERR